MASAKKKTTGKHHTRNQPEPANEVPINEGRLRIELIEPVPKMGKAGDAFTMTQNEYAQCQKQGILWDAHRDGEGELVAANHRVIGTPGKPENDRVRGLTADERKERDQGTEA